MATQHSSSMHSGRVPLILAPARPSKGGLSQKLDQMADFMLKYWGHLITIILGILVFSALSVPFLSYFGLNSIAKPIFYSLHYVCAQVPSHSFYIFGHQLGFCARNLAIYASMFLGGLVFVLSNKKMRGIPWWIWILMILPMAWDGTTQLFGWRESDWLLRLVTGALFGFGNMWFALPLMQKSLDTPPASAYVYMPQPGYQAPLPAVQESTVMYQPVPAANAHLPEVTAQPATVAETPSLNGAITKSLEGEMTPRREDLATPPADTLENRDKTE